MGCSRFSSAAASKVRSTTSSLCLQPGLLAFQDARCSATRGRRDTFVPRARCGALAPLSRHSSAPSSAASIFSFEVGLGSALRAGGRRRGCVACALPALPLLLGGGGCRRPWSSPWPCFPLCSRPACRPRPAACPWRSRRHGYPAAPRHRTRTARCVPTSRSPTRRTRTRRLRCGLGRAPSTPGR